LGKYCSQLRENSTDIKDDKSDVDKILGRYWNHSTAYYNAACFYAIKASKAGLNEKKFKKEAEKKGITASEKAGFKEKELEEGNLKKESVKEAMKNLIIAFRDPHSGFDKEWVKKDPDLQSLHEDLEYKALFDLPDEKEEKSNNEKVWKSNSLALILVKEGSKQQIKLLKKWGKSSDSKLTPEELLVGANHQVDVWRSFTRLAEKPADSTAQKQFWDLVMLYADQLTPQPDIKKYSLLKKLTQKDLDDCWKALKEEIQPNPKLWEDRATEIKLFLKHAKTQKNDVWELWSKAEIRKWEYLTERIKKLPGLEKL
jgi:hypothetical protein